LLGPQVGYEAHNSELNEQTPEIYLSRTTERNEMKTNLSAAQGLVDVIVTYQSFVYLPLQLRGP